MARMYRGEHHPTDILGSLLFAALWLTATTLLIKPNDNARHPAGSAGVRDATRAARAGTSAGQQPAERQIG
jgi:undecaprenyl-diphosphatase